MTEAERVAAGLTEAQRVLILGNYDPEFARMDDAIVLEKLWLWSYDRTKQDPDSEYYDLDATELGLAVRDILRAKEAGHVEG